MSAPVCLFVAQDSLKAIDVRESESRASYEQSLSCSELRLFRLISRCGDSLRHLYLDSSKRGRITQHSIRALGGTNCFANLRTLQVEDDAIESWELLFSILSLTPALTTLRLAFMRYPSSRQLLNDSDTDSEESDADIGNDEGEKDQYAFSDETVEYPRPACKLQNLSLYQCDSLDYPTCRLLLSQSHASLHTIELEDLSYKRTARGICAALSLCTRLRNVACIWNNFSTERVLRACAEHVTTLTLRRPPSNDFFVRACPKLRKLHFRCEAWGGLEQFFDTYAEALIDLLPSMPTVGRIVFLTDPFDEELTIIHTGLRDACRRRRIHLVTASV